MRLLGWRLQWVYCLAAALVASGAVCARGDVQFNRDVRPILSDRCFHCHGPDEESREAELRLDVADGEQGAYRDAYGVIGIVPGDPDASEVWARVIATDPDLRMPPEASHKPALTDHEKAIVREWIEQGAPYQPFWSFTPPKMPDVDSAAGLSPIDHLVQQQLQQSSLSFAKAASKRTLLRRVTQDLTGLPPTREAIQAFLDDPSADAYTKVVDRLLASPAYGEHMARYWLDLVRFADTNGVHHDHYRELTPYRDWVIRSFNDNLSFDQFVRWQLAGDLYPEPTQDQLIASGFHRLHLIIDVGTALPQESYTRNVIDRVTSLGTAFLGLTVQCAVCHDHKYDPISQKEFFSLFAFFNNLDAEPETGKRHTLDHRRGLQQPYINLATPEQQRLLHELESCLKFAEQNVQACQQELDNNSDANQQATFLDALNAAKASQESLQTTREELLVSLPAAMVMKERTEVRPAYLLNRGVYDDFGEEVPRATPAFLPPLNPADDLPTRMDLANWLVDPQHPLTARVTVNRFWQQLFGVGLVKTSEDFGAQGQTPSHPELLDYLAVQFVRSGWDVKALMREMVLARTYQQTSIASRESYEQDPENRLLARGARYRLDAELIRDQVLATCGSLNRRMYGKSVRPPQPEGLWKAVSMPDSNPRTFRADTGDAIYRRSLYTFWKRGMPPPQMTIMNAPSREACIARRERTNTPLQALLLLNEQEYLLAARRLATLVLANADATPQQRIQEIYETITSQLPTKSQQQALQQLASDLQALYAGSPRLADQFCAGAKLPQHISPAELAAWSMVCSTVYNLDVARTRQ